MFEKEILSSRQIMALIILFLFGSSVVVGVNINLDVSQDSWISLLLSLIYSTILGLIFARIITIYPGENIYYIFEDLFGKVVGKIFSLFFAVHTIYLGSIVLRNFSEFVGITTIPETPQIPIMLLLILVIVYLAKSGSRTLGRWAVIIFPILIFTVLLTIALSIPIMDYDNLKPILNHSLNQMLSSSFKIFMLPFSELVVFLGIADLFKKKDNNKKTILYGIYIAGLILLLVIIRNTIVLGVPMTKNSFFASYNTARVLEIGEFLARIEGVITINFILAGITKITVCLISASKGVTKILNLKDYKNNLFPIGLIILAICPILFEDVMDMFNFAFIFAIYSIPIQVILPIFIWIIAEFKNRKIKTKYKRHKLISKFST